MQDHLLIWELIERGETDEAARVARDAAFDVRRGARNMSGADAFEFTKACGSLPLWPECEFWARYTLARVTGAETVVRAFTLLIVAVAAQHRWGDAAAELDGFHEPRGDPGDDAIFQLEVNAGRTLIHTGRAEDALARFDRAARHSSAANARLLSALHLNRGVALRALGRMHDATAAYREALRFAAEQERATILVNLGNVQKELDDFDEAARFYEQALAASGDDLVMRGSVLSNLGELRWRQRRHAEARDLLDAALDARRRAGDLTGQAVTTGHLAKLATSQADFTQALALIEESLRISRRAGVPDDRGLVGLAAEINRLTSEQRGSSRFSAELVVEQLHTATHLDGWAAAVRGVPREVLELAGRCLDGEAPLPVEIGPIRRRTFKRFVDQVLELGADFAVAREREHQAELAALLAALVKLVRIEDWLERKRFYESQQELFDGGETIGVVGFLEENSAGYRLDLNEVFGIRELINACREKGIDRAFAELPGKSADELLARFVHVGSWRESKCLIEAHEWYLGDEAISALEELLRTKTPPAQQPRVEAHLGLLRACRAEGVDKAFASIPAVDGDDPLGVKFFIGQQTLSGTGGHDFFEIAQQLGDPLLKASMGLRAAREQLARTDGDRGRNLRTALELLTEAGKTAFPETTPLVHTSIAMAIGDVCLELGRLEPEGAARIFRAVDAFTEALDATIAAIDPARKHAAARKLSEAIRIVLDGAVHESDRVRLRRLHGRACSAAVEATDALMKAGEVPDRQTEFSASLWAYSGLVDAAFDEGSPAAALVAAERARGRGFLTEVGRLTELPAYIPRDIADREAAARARLRRLRTENPPDEVTLNEAEQELREVHQALATISPELAQAREGTRPTAEELRSFARSLGPDTLVLAWYTSPSRCLAFAVSGGTAEVRAEEVPLTSDDLESHVRLAAADLWRQPTRPDQAISPAWREFADALVPHAWHGLVARARQVLLIPHGLLHELPLHALPLSCLGGRALIEAAPVRHLPSLTVAQRLRHRSPAGDTAIVLANPKELSTEFGREASAVANLLGSEPPTSEAGRIAELGSRASILHIAAHGFFDPGDPLGSGLELAGGVLTAREVIGLTRFPGTVVVLSGCESNRRIVRATDESEGLVRSFLVAGAGAVVASQWRVDSRATRRLMEAFHRNLAGCADPAGALREAALDLRASAPHPYYWAPFVAVGV
ncbi:hypothetical protein GCM10022222_07060 [Amycolatopsis ultiminotia]|uniref:CHAT domain-containing protein n=1 Tax=Amycolatopsis ultiminotia TaxID=543629 RepID=A0ABP6V1P6_9PSEU